MLASNLFIETERLIIRRFTVGDVEPAFRMNLDPDVSRFTGDGGIVSKSEIERRIIEDVLGDYEKHGFGRLAVELKAAQTFIGFTGLKYLENLDEIDLGYRFMKEYWGMGIATEAGKASVNLGFDTLGLDQIIAMVLPQNIGSIRVLEKLSFQYKENIVEDRESIQCYTLEKNDAPNMDYLTTGI